MLKFKTTKEIEISPKIIDQIIGQDEAVKLIKKAAKQRRNMLLIGDPGTGKSMIGQALAELLPEETLKDIISIPNSSDENNPIIKEVPKGEGKKIVTKSKLQAMSSFKNQNIFFFILLIISVITPWWIRSVYGDIMAAASLIGSMIFLASFVIFINLSRRIKTNEMQIPKLLVDNSIKDKNLFIDATGAHDGALLGDVLHDPLQSFVTNKLQQIIEIRNKENKELQIKEIEMNSVINNLIKKHNNELIKKNNYIATYLDKNELSILSENKGVAEPAEVLSVNRYSKKGELIKIITESGKELIITPEHKVAVKKFRKIIYKEAIKLTRFDKLITTNL